jgi:phosphoglycolate phosphatase-like HAD superfamily hydrolase
MIKVIIFDFDGVLVESVDVKTRAFAKLFEEYGPDVVKEVTDYHITNGGVSRFEKIKYYYSHILKKPLDKSRLDKLCNQFASIVIEQVVSAPPVEGADLFLSQNYKNLDFYIVSGTPQDEIRTILKRRQMDCYFKGVYGSPAEKHFLIRDILDNIKIERRLALFVGDTMTDYNAALANEVNFIGRVAPGDVSLFPSGTRLITDLTSLEIAIAEF